MTVYFALLRKDPDSDFGGDFPDFPGCITAGSTLEETREMAAEALQAHIGCMVDLGQQIPPPSSIDGVMADPENAEAIAFPVTIPGRLTGIANVDLALAVADLEKLDALAEQRGTTREALLAEAVRRLLAGAREHHAA